MRLRVRTGRTRFQVSRLVPTTCASREAGPRPAGSSTTGYGNQCYNNVTWDGSASDISGATAVHVTAGATTSSINAGLPNGGVIAGTVDDSSSHPLSDVEVEVVTSGGTEIGYAETNTNGSYTISGLSAGTYNVCFDATFTTGGASTTGYHDQCYNNVSWNGTIADISGATAVHVTAGTTTSGNRRESGERVTRRGVTSWRSHGAPLSLEHLLGEMQDPREIFPRRQSRWSKLSNVAAGSP